MKKENKNNEVMGDIAENDGVIVEVYKSSINDMENLISELEDSLEIEKKLNNNNMKEIQELQRTKLRYEKIIDNLRM
jgi:hypothetical protein